MAGPNGGARPGAGRKPKAQVFENEITKADKRIAKNLIRYIENMERLADGVLTEDTNIVTGDTSVYREAPNRQANEYLINRIMGKPVERQEVSGRDGEPIAVREVVVRLAKHGPVDDH
jgi:hypothetical protein